MPPCLFRQVPVYLVHVESRLREESSRGNAYLDYSTRTPLINCVERQLIANHAQTLLDRGVCACLCMCVWVCVGVCGCVWPLAYAQSWHCGDPSPTSHTCTAGSRARLPPPATPKSQGSHPCCRAYPHELFCTCPGLFALCDEPRVDAIALMFTLLCRVGAVDPIRTTFLNYIVVRVHARACLSHGMSVVSGGG